jgi:hypothetical protein
MDFPIFVASTFSDFGWCGLTVGKPPWLGKRNQASRRLKKLHDLVHNMTAFLNRNHAVELLPSERPPA